LKAKLALSGVKTTLNRVAEKLEFVMQVASEFDSRIRIADANGTKVEMVAMTTERHDDNRILAMECGWCLRRSGRGWKCRNQRRKEVDSNGVWED
jgi:hypothetical protein